MKTRLRTRQPKAVKERKGTLDKRWSAENEMEVATTKELAAPSSYDKRKQELWHKYTGALSDNGILSEMDYEILVMLCDAVAMYEECYKLLQKKGLTYETEHGIRYRPEYKIMKDSQETALKLGLKFGITPAGRAMIDVQPKKKNVADDLFTID
jgi:P27 family predicted phage terminase small subunit